MKGLFKLNEDGGYGPGMMFGISGPGPKADTEGIPSDKEKEQGIDIKELGKLPTSFKKYSKKIKEEAEANELYESVLNEIGDSSAKPFKWKTTNNVSKWLASNAEGAKDKQHSGSYDDRYSKTTLSFRYEFTSDTTGTKYHVHIGGYFGKNFWFSLMGDKPEGWQAYHAILGLGFGVDGVEGDPETNLNEQFRVMATVVECALDFLQKCLDDKGDVSIQEFHMNPKLDKEEQKGMDSRRGKLYMAYIKNSFKKLRTKKHYYIEQTKDGFVLKFGEVRVGGTNKIPDHVLAATYESFIQAEKTGVINGPSFSIHNKKPGDVIEVEGKEITIVEFLTWVKDEDAKCLSFKGRTPEGKDVTVKYDDGYDGYILK
jgi:hypothetical protein